MKNETSKKSVSYFFIRSGWTPKAIVTDPRSSSKIQDDPKIENEKKSGIWSDILMIGVIGLIATPLLPLFLKSGR